MKKNVRNALAISGLALAIGASGFTLEASANSGSNSNVQRSHQERIHRTKKVSIEKMKHGRHFVTGIVNSLDSTSLTVIRGSKTYTIHTSSDTRTLNRAWETIALSDIKIGNKLKVSGPITDMTINAKTIRDVSLPETK